MADTQPVKEKIVYVEKKRRGCMLPLLGLVVLAAIGAGIYAATGGMKSTPAVNVPGGATVAVNQANPAPALSELVNQKKALTDAQWDAYADSLKGKGIVVWPGTVKSVDQKPFSDLYVMAVDVQEPTGAASAFDLNVDVSKADGLKINKGQAVTVSGNIRKIACVLTFCPIELDSASYTLK